MPKADPTSLPSPQPNPGLPEFPATGVSAGVGGPLPPSPHIFLCGASIPGEALPDSICTLNCLAWPPVPVLPHAATCLAVHAMTQLWQRP